MLRTAAFEDDEVVGRPVSEDEMNHSGPAEGDGSGRSKEDLVNRILDTALKHGIRNLSEANAKGLANDIWDYHPHRDKPEVSDQFIKDTLRWIQDERKLEQSYLTLFLTLWFLLCSPLVAASAYASTLPSQGLRFGLTRLCALFISALCVVFFIPISASMKAQTYRHFQLVILTSELPRYRAWGFGWRVDHRRDRVHSRAFAAVISSIVFVLVASWSFVWHASRPATEDKVVLPPPVTAPADAARK